MCCIELCLRGACCCCSALCNDTCKVLKYQCGLSKRQQVRIAYLVLSFLSIICALCMMYFLPQYLGIWQMFIQCPEPSGGGLVCLGVSAVYRMSACLVILYLFLLIICLLRDDCSRLINENFWCCKAFLILGGFVGLMFINKDIFEVYGQVALYAGGMFLLFQIVMLIDLFYLLGEILKAKYDQGYQYMAYILIGLAIILYGFTFYLNYLNFQWFPCERNTNIINSALITIITILVFTGWFQNGSLITSGLMSLYLTYQIWAGLINNDDQTCNLLKDNENSLVIQTYFGIFFIFCSLIYISVCSSQKGGQISEKINILENQPPKDSDDDDFLQQVNSDSDEEIGTELQIQNKNNDVAKIKSQQKIARKQARQLKRLRDYQSNSYIYFHLVMVLCSFYIAVVLTNWGTPVINNQKWEGYKATENAKNINIICSYLSWIVYIWTLLAPKIFPDRDFSSNVQTY